MEEIMERRRRRGGVMMKASHVYLLLLALLHCATTSSAQNTSSTTSAAPPASAALAYISRPTGLRVAVGEPAEFRCGVPAASPNITFTFYGGHGNYSLTCPQGHVEDIPKALYGACEMKGGESLAVWTLKGTSYYDNGTKVVCQQLRNPEAPAAVLNVYESGLSYATLIGCTIGGFFGVLLVAALAYVMLVRSETLQRWFRGKDIEDDKTTIVTKD